MKLNVLAASALAAGVSASANALVERQIYERDILALGPDGSLCPPIPTTVIVLQPIFQPNATTTSFITTTTTVFPGDITTDTPAPTGTFTPPFSLGEGLPSGTFNDLPFEQFFFLAYSTPGAAPTVLAKRDNELERRQRVQATASPIRLVDISVATPAPPAFAAVQCDDATPLNLVSGVLNGNQFSVGKLLNSRDAILGALSNPPADQVNVTFGVSNGILQWNAPDVGGATFYSCANTIYAGFPDLVIPGCTEVTVGPIAGAVCIQYVQSSRGPNPTFTAPLTSTPTATGTGSGTTATGTESTTTAADSTTTGTGTATDTDTSATGTDSTTTGSGTATGSGTSATETGTGTTSDTTDAGTGTGTSTGTPTTTTFTTTSASPGGTAAPDCLVVLPEQCFDALTGVGRLDLLALATGVTTCTNSLGSLSIDGTLAATQCLTANLLDAGTTGDSILDCLSQRLLCSSNTATISPAPTPSPILGLANCLDTLPQACLDIELATGNGLLGAATECTTALATLVDIPATVRAATCLANAVTTALTGGTGANIFGCLNTQILCSSVSPPGPSTTTTTAGGILACLPSTDLPPSCTDLPSAISITIVAQAALCALDLNPLLTQQGVDLTAITDTLSCVTDGITSSSSGAALLTCLTSSAGICPV